MSQVKTLITAEQLPELAPSSRAELVGGEVVERMPVGRRHGKTVIEMGRTLGSFVAAHGLGEVLTELGVILTRDPDVVRAPDLAFISTARLASASADGYFDGAPDLAVEVLSPDDRASDVQEKVREYLSAGSRMVWVVDPRTRTVTAQLPSGDAHVYGPGDTLSGEPVLPGFSVRVSDLIGV